VDISKTARDTAKVAIGNRIGLHPFR